MAMSTISRRCASIGESRSTGRHRKEGSRRLRSSSSPLEWHLSVSQATLLPEDDAKEIRDDVAEHTFVDEEGLSV